MESSDVDIIAKIAGNVVVSNNPGEMLKIWRKRLKIKQTNLAKKMNVKADLVAPVPDSGTVAAIGYSRASNIQFDLALIRNHYVGRTFIEPQGEIRHFGVKLKHHHHKGDHTYH